MKKERTKGFVAGLLVAVLALGLIGTAAATIGKRTVEVDYTDIKIELNGEKVTPVDANGNAVEPFAINGTTYLPVRAVSNALGLDVGWDGATSTVKLNGKSDFHEVYVQMLGAMDVHKTIEDMAEYGDFLYKTLVDNVSQIFTEYTDLNSVKEDLMQYTSNYLPEYKAMMETRIEEIDDLLAESKTEYLRDCLNSAKTSYEKLLEGYDDLATAYVFGYLCLSGSTHEDWDEYRTYGANAFKCFLDVKIDSRYSEIRSTLAEMLEG